MDKSVIKDLIAENQYFIEKVTILPRSVSLEQHGNYVFVGLRRAGKTYLMYRQIQNLIRAGISVKEILYITFEDERLSEITTADLSVILNCYREMYDYQPIIFLDEIQLITGWEKFVRRLADSNYRVYVTGSNAKMLSSEIATTLGGRFLILTVHPYSFREFLAAHGIEFQKNMEHGNDGIRLRKLFATFFYYGGLPELQRFDDKRQWLNSLYQKIFFGDLIARYQIRNIQALKIIIKKLAESVMSPISYTRLSNIVISTGIKISKTTVIEYIDYLKETWLVFSVSNITGKLVEKETSQKYYFSDNGILNLFIFNPETALLENLVAITLKRLYENEVYFYNQNVEVDFYIPSAKWAIQVAYKLVDEETIKRETTALLKFRRFMPAERLTIITYDEENIIKTEEAEIEIIPVWKWLLNK